MQANELRIGNWYNDKRINRDFVVHGVSKHGIDHGDSDYSPTRIQNAMPIPLTEEWLTRFGFEDEKLYEEFFEYSINRNHRIQTDGEIFVFLGYRDGVEIKYLHQLQNLYFALTGKELELKQ
jgi:hypothetical protein